MNRLKNNKAQAMILAFVYLGAIAILSVVLLYYANSINRQMAKALNHTRAYYAAEAGLVRKLMELSISGDTDSQIFCFPDVNLIPNGTGCGYNRVDVNVSVSVVGNRVRSVVTNWFYI